MFVGNCERWIVENRSGTVIMAVSLLFRDTYLESNVDKLIQQLRFKDNLTTAIEMFPNIEFESQGADGLVNEQRRAAETLLFIGARAVKPLISVLGDKRTSNAHSEAAKILVAIGKPAVEPLSHALANSDSNVRTSVAEILGKIGDPRAVESLCQVLYDPDSNVSAQAASALAIIGDERAIRPLCAALCYPDGPRNVSVAGALIAMGGKSLDELIFTLQFNYSENVRAASAAVLGQIRDANAVEALCAALTNDKSINVKYAAARALGMIGDVRAVDILCKFVASSFTVSVYADALGQIGGAEGLPCKILLSTELSVQARANLLNTLCSRKTRYYSQGVYHRYSIEQPDRYCEAMRNNPDEHVRNSAVEVLHYLSGDTLLRPSQTSGHDLLRSALGAEPTLPPSELLRAASATESTTPPSELLRGGDVPLEPDPPEPTLFQRLRGSKRKMTE